jgi:hypothetical protein
MRILKYTLDHTKMQQEVMIPAGAEILSAKNRSGKLCIWAMTDPDRPEEPRLISVVETGVKLANLNRKFIDTVNMGAFSLHVFELIKFKTPTNENI